MVLLKKLHFTITKHFLKATSHVSCLLILSRIPTPLVGWRATCNRSSKGQRFHRPQHSSIKNRVMGSRRFNWRRILRWRMRGLYRCSERHWRISIRSSHGASRTTSRQRLTNRIWRRDLKWSPMRQASSRTLLGWSMRWRHELAARRWTRWPQTPPTRERIAHAKAVNRRSQTC